jgi:hypothetical protein
LRTPVGRSSPPPRVRPLLWRAGLADSPGGSAR